MTDPSPWRRYYDNAGAAEYRARFSTMGAAWNHQIATRPDEPAVFFFDATLTFREIDSATDALAAALQGRGVGAGERVAIYLQNDPQWLVAMLAAWKIGAIPVAVSPMLRRHELEHLLVDSGAVAIVCLEELYVDVAAQVLPATSVTTVVTTHPLDMTPTAAPPTGERLTMPPPRALAGTLKWREVMDDYAGSQPVLHASLPTDPGMLTYTSGTTGQSKGAINLHSGMVHNSNVFRHWWDLQPDRDVNLGIAPAFHVTGVIAGFGVVAVAGVPLILTHRFDAEAILRAIQRRKATFVVAAATAYLALSNCPALKEFDVTSLTKVASGGAPVSTALVDRVRHATGWTIHGAYGLTETTSPIHLGPPHVDTPVDLISGALAVGVPVPGCEVRIVDPTNGTDVLDGSTGEIVVRGPMVFPGYWGRPVDTAAAIRDGWFHTGDVGKQTDDGWLFVVDRIKDIINASGYKVYPREVEDVLHQHPAVREAAVTGIPDDYRGETVKAFVSTVSGMHVDESELIDFCRDRLAAYKYPRSVQFMDELPKNASGKVLRRDLRALQNQPGDIIGDPAAMGPRP